ncbi:uncharacterized protein LOC110111351 [Dendrobium catenatum]|uniref:uncharacterized protein LOC110111351 n=1 Tax=Dendrobium catenatum TaxID=906689 RepID=UPI0009F2D716|nr:uncharacterized protein LOC110111351 [Dendrobium catenatum]
MDLLVMREPSEDLMKVSSLIIGKGKQVATNLNVETPYSMVEFKSNDIESSSSGMNIFVNTFRNNVNLSKRDPSVQNMGASTSAVHENVQTNIEGLIYDPVKIGHNPWTKHPYIKLNLPKGDSFMSDDGKEIKLYEPKMIENIEKLQKSIMVKVFGKAIPVQIIAAELRHQWSPFGKFHITILGSSWMLCSFFSTDSMEKVISGGPWFVNGHIIGLDKWNPKFSTTFLKGLTSPVWVRFLNLPLYCWDKINVARTTSLIGTPMLIDSDMF